MSTYYKSTGIMIRFHLKFYFKTGMNLKTVFKKNQPPFVIINMLKIEYFFPWRGGRVV